MTRRSFRTAAAPLALCALALLAAGCGGGREYAMPKELCGVPVGEKELSPLLPDGQKLDVAGDPLVTSANLCGVSVDDDPAVDIQVEKTEKFYDPMDASEAFRFTNREKSAGLPFEGAGATGDKHVMITARCDAPEAGHLIVNIGVGEKAEKDVDRRRSDLEAFARAFVPSVKKEMGCTA
ncbi:hypothetical protein AB0K62_32025 [Streptomyces halstedii]|uniref:hypothetical protein n=1 Tax=Streptomyces halstedii TaxID=1944 RepID=UPI00345F31E9|nr:hypothetical protein OG291_19830 [Streptomyces halstedii]